MKWERILWWKRNKKERKQTLPYWLHRVIYKTTTKKNNGNTMLKQPDHSIRVFSPRKERDLHKNNMFVLALFIFLIVSVQTRIIIKKNFSYMAHGKSQRAYNGWHISRGKFLVYIEEYGQRYGNIQ